MALVTTDQLIETGHKYRKELLAMPLVQLKQKMEGYAKFVYNVRGKLTVGSLSNDSEIMPWKPGKNAKDTNDIEFRTLETYMGKVVEEFDPHLLAASIYGNAIATDPTQTNIAKAVAMEMVKTIGNKLFKAIFTGVRKSDGSKTTDLLDGFTTILNKEIANGNIAAAKRNLLDVGSVNKANTYDTLRGIYRNASEELRETNTVLFVSYDIKDDYEDDYAAQFGSSPYNKEFKQTYLQGTDGRCRIVAMSPLAGSGRMILTTANNLLIGCDQTSDDENVTLRVPDDPFMVQLSMKTFYGVEFESIDNRLLMAVKYTTE